MVGYEELIASPFAVLERICHAPDLDIDPAMRDGRAAPPGARAERTQASWKEWRARHEGAARAPISSASLGKWREKLGPLELAVIEAICDEGMVQQGDHRESSAVMRRQAGRLGRAMLSLSDAGIALRRLWRAAPSPVGP